MKNIKNKYIIDLIDNYYDEKNKIINNDIKKEINLMKSIKSKYIVKLINNFYDETYEGYCIVMELCDDDLKNINQKGYH